LSKKEASYDHSSGESKTNINPFDDEDDNPFGAENSDDDGGLANNPFGDDMEPSNPFEDDGGAVSNPFGEETATSNNPFGDDEDGMVASGSQPHKGCAWGDEKYEGWSKQHIIDDANRLQSLLDLETSLVSPNP